MKVIVAGRASGKILKSRKAINFLGALEKETGKVRDSEHDLFGRTVGGSVLVFPNGVGSSVGAYTIYALNASGVAPVAMICQKADLTTASGCALADIPLLVASENECAKFEDGQTVLVDTEASPPVSFG